MRVHCLILGVGYVEHSRLSSLVMWNRNGFDTVEEAIESLADLFLENTKKDLASTVDYSKRYQRCPHCDEPWHKERETTQLDVREFIRHIAGSDCDSSGGEFWDDLDRSGWQTGLSGFPRARWAEAVDITQCAEYIIADAAFGGRTVAERGATDSDHWNDWNDWATYMKLPEGMALYKETP